MDIDRNSLLVNTVAFCVDLLKAGNSGFYQTPNPFYCCVLKYVSLPSTDLQDEDCQSHKGSLPLEGDKALKEEAPFDINIPHKTRKALDMLRRSQNEDFHTTTGNQAGSSHQHGDLSSIQS